MSILLIFIVGFGGIIAGKFFFEKWFNHVTLYSLIWMVMLVAYEAKLMKFVEISPLAWMMICGAFLSFVIGSITQFSLRSNLSEVQELSVKYSMKIFEDDARMLKITIAILSSIALFSAAHSWWILISKYGSVVNVFLNAVEIYRQRIEGEIQGIIPFIHLTGYVGIFYSALLIGYQKKISLISILPFIAVVLKEVSNLGRAGMLTGFFLFIATYFLYSNFFKSEKTDERKYKMILTFVVIIVIIVAAAGLIRSTRGTIESFKGTSGSLASMRAGFLITPSLYLYMSSHVGVFSKYIENDYDNGNHFGEKTFQPVYNLLSRFDIVKHPGFYEKGYYIPMWTNTGTYLRALFGDFGVAGIFLFPYLIGIFTTFLWIQVKRSGGAIRLIFLCFLYVMILFSPITMISHHSIWTLTLFIVIMILPTLEKISSWNKRRIDAGLSIF